MKRVRIEDLKGLRVRPPLGRYGSPGQVPLPPPLRLELDPLELLREERQPER